VLLLEALLHVLLEEVDGVDLCDALDCEVEALVAELVAADGLLDEWDVGREVEGEAFGDVGDEVEDALDVEVLVYVGLHDLEQLVDYLAHVLLEGLALFEGVDCLEHLDVEFDLVRGDPVGAYSQEHGHDDIQVIVEDRDVELPDGVHGLRGHAQVLMLPFVLDQLEHLGEQEVHVCDQVVLAVDVEELDQVEHWDRLREDHLVDSLEYYIRVLVDVSRHRHNDRVQALVQVDNQVEVISLYQDHQWGDYHWQELYTVRAQVLHYVRHPLQHDLVVVSKGGVK
jgi:hypothetical protein